MSSIEIMEAPLTNTNNIKVVTYVFDGRENKVVDSPLKTKIWQIFPPSTVYLVSFVFGIMMGWCSPIYPHLLLEDSEVPINLDQTALIAGFLMIGNMFGTIPAHFLPFGTKYGIISGLFLMSVSWFTLWHATDIYAILASRFLIGFGNSFGSHHGKEYIKQMSESHIRDQIIKSVQLYIGSGTLLAYSFGPYVNFRTYSVISLIITAVISVFCLFLPHSPLELVKYNKLTEAKLILRHLKPGLDAEPEIEKLRFSLENTTVDYGVEIIKNKAARCKFAVLMFLVFFQQFCGVPSTMVYCIMILRKISCPNPEILAIVYILFFLFGNAIGTYYLHRHNMKYCLLFSSFSTSVFLALNTLILYFDSIEKWAYTPYLAYIFMIFFILFHSIGLGPLPFLLTPKLFPQHSFVSHVQTIFYSIWAIVVTKVFQVLFTKYELHVPFLMFTVAGILGTLFIVIFIPEDLSKLTRNRTKKAIVNNGL